MTDRHQLVVSFMRTGEPIERMAAADGAGAWDNAILMISRREILQHGDMLVVRRAEPGGEP